MWLCSFTKHDGLHAFWERLHSGIPIDCMLACNGKQWANVKSDHNNVFNSTTVQIIICRLRGPLAASTRPNRSALSYRPTQTSGSETEASVLEDIREITRFWLPFCPSCPLLIPQIKHSPAVIFLYLFYQLHAMLGTTGLLQSEPMTALLLSCFYISRKEPRKQPQCCPNLGYIKNTF